MSDPKPRTKPPPTADEQVAAILGVLDRADAVIPTPLGLDTRALLHEWALYYKYGSTMLQKHDLWASAKAHCAYVDGFIPDAVGKEHLEGLKIHRATAAKIMRLMDEALIQVEVPKWRAEVDAYRAALEPQIVLLCRFLATDAPEIGAAPPGYLSNEAVQRRKEWIQKWRVVFNGPFEVPGHPARGFPGGYWDGGHWCAPHDAYYSDGIRGLNGSPSAFVPRMVPAAQVYSPPYKPPAHAPQPAVGEVQVLYPDQGAEYYRQPPTAAEHEAAVWLMECANGGAAHPDWALDDAHHAKEDTEGRAEQRK